MRKTLCAGVLALAALAPLATAPAAQAVEGSIAAQGEPAAAVNIARIKHVLNLRPDQRAYWPPVEAALRRVAQEQAEGVSGGLIHRISHRVVSIVLTGAAIQRLASAARPLIARLDDGQKMAAMQLADEMGLGAVVAALN
ncbi:MAG TPA: hypothetical protein VE224_20410 [Pseudolabrys sp.]|nr:hypothetical protein [Pseudolabrys sp.]